MYGKDTKTPSEVWDKNIPDTLNGRLHTAVGATENKGSRNAALFV